VNGHDRNIGRGGAHLSSRAYLGLSRGHLAYASEIAQAMLRRPQANAAGPLPRRGRPAAGDDCTFVTFVATARKNERVTSGVGAGSFVLLDGRPVRITADGVETVPDSPELRDLIALRDAAWELLTLEADADRPDDAVAPARSVAAERYRGYVERWGPLNRAVVHELRGGRPDPQTGLPELRLRRPDLGGFRADPGYHAVMALEVYDAETQAAEPAPVLLRRVHGRPAGAAGGQRARGTADLPGRGPPRSGPGGRAARAAHGGPGRRSVG
jgi:hypothetical protein